MDWTKMPWTKRRWTKTGRTIHYTPLLYIFNIYPHIRHATPVYCIHTPHIRHAIPVYCIHIPHIRHTASINISMRKLNRIIVRVARRVWASIESGASCMGFY